MDPLPSDQLNQEARLMARYDEGSAPSDATEEEAEGEAHGWLIARSAFFWRKPMMHITKQEQLFWC